MSRWRPTPGQKAADRRTNTLVYVAPSTIHGKGLFARRPLEEGQHVGTYLGPAAQRNGSHVLWVEDGEGWTGRRGFNRLRYLNHSGDPNAEFDGFDLYVIRPIEPHEEITIDYHWD